MDRLTTLTVELRLSPPTLGYAVDLRLRRCGDRWVTEADVPGRRSVGLGGSAREALAAALAPLGRSAVAVVLADLGLLRPSYEILAAPASESP